MLLTAQSERGFEVAFRRVMQNCSRGAYFYHDYPNPDSPTGFLLPCPELRAPTRWETIKFHMWGWWFKPRLYKGMEVPEQDANYIPY